MAITPFCWLCSWNAVVFDFPWLSFFWYAICVVVLTFKFVLRTERISSKCCALLTSFRHRNTMTMIIYDPMYATGTFSIVYSFQAGISGRHIGLVNHLKLSRLCSCLQKRRKIPKSLKLDSQMVRCCNSLQPWSHGDFMLVGGWWITDRFTERDFPSMGFHNIAMVA